MARHVRDRFASAEQAAELFDAAEHVERLLSTPGYRAVLDIINREVATIDRELDEGPAKEAADYAKQHGRRGALRSFDEAAKAIIDVARKARVRAEERARRDDAAAEAAERMAA